MYTTGIGVGRWLFATTLCPELRCSRNQCPSLRALKLSIHGSIHCCKRPTGCTNDAVSKRICQQTCFIHKNTFGSCDSSAFYPRFLLLGSKLRLIQLAPQPVPVQFQNMILFYAHDKKRTTKHYNHSLGGLVLCCMTTIFKSNLSSSKM